MTADLVKEILIDLGIGETQINAHARLKEDLELDSTDTVQVALDLKRRLDVDIAFASGEDMTVGDLCALIEQRKQQRAAKAAV